MQLQSSGEVQSCLGSQAMLRCADICKVSIPKRSM